MSQVMRIDFVSDISCPWCVIGLTALEKAILNIQNTANKALDFEVYLQPFELNPKMPQGGQDISEHLTQKYGSSPEQQSQIRKTIRQRGAELGFEFRVQGRDRIYNTFNAHRLLHWATLEGLAGQAVALKKALFSAYFTHGQSPENFDVLIQAAQSVGLDPLRAKEVLETNEFAQEVRDHANLFIRSGIQSVPAIIINQKHLISGGQPVDVFERVLLEIASSEQN
jgi:predicted DsbA family dithiol-disulfide isomerase